jgi:hypothetical protein
VNAQGIPSGTNPRPRRLAVPPTIRIWATTLVALLFLSIPRTVGAQVVSRGTDGTVSVKASGVPLVQLLEKLAEIRALEKLIVNPAVGGLGVTVTIENVNPVQAIKEVLAAAGVDYVLSSTRLVVGSSDFIGTAPPTNAQTPQAMVERLEEQLEQPEEAASRDSTSERDAQRRDAELMHALAAPPVGVAPGAIIDLPFPAADGRTPLTDVKGLQPPSAVPFPVDVGPGQTTAAPSADDPRLLELMKALSPKRGPGSR